MTKKKNDPYKGILDTTKITIGVGLGTHIGATMLDKTPTTTVTPQIQKHGHAAMGIMAPLPLISGAKTTLHALKDWEDIDF